jgi:hypothetical protein
VCLARVYSQMVQNRVRSQMVLNADAAAAAVGTSWGTSWGTSGTIADNVLLDVSVDGTQAGPEHEPEHEHPTPFMTRPETSSQLILVQGVY